MSQAFETWLRNNVYLINLVIVNTYQTLQSLENEKSWFLAISIRKILEPQIL